MFAPCSKERWSGSSSEGVLATGACVGACGFAAGLSVGAVSVVVTSGDTDFVDADGAGAAVVVCGAFGWGGAAEIVALYGASALTGCVATVAVLAAEAGACSATSTWCAATCAVTGLSVGAISVAVAASRAGAAAPTDKASLAVGVGLTGGGWFSTAIVDALGAGLTGGGGTVAVLGAARGAWGCLAAAVDAGCAGLTA